MSAPITEEWLKSAGFKWHQLDRQPSKHWLLWLGWALPSRDQAVSFGDAEDLGLELAQTSDGTAWHCWLRADYAGRYTRFLHVRHLETQDEVATLIGALIGSSFDPANAFYGTLRTPEAAVRERAKLDRLDRQIMLERPHNDMERDDTMGGALPEHRVAYEKSRKP